METADLAEPERGQSPSPPDLLVVVETSMYPTRTVRGGPIWHLRNPNPDQASCFYIKEKLTLVKNLLNIILFIFVNTEPNVTLSLLDTYIDILIRFFLQTWLILIGGREV